MNKLTISNLVKYYKKLKVVDNISLTVSSREIIGLLGPNGAGKTTTFYMIMGLINSDSGAIMLNNKTITNLAIHNRAKLGLNYLPQEPSIFRKLSVKNNKTDEN